MWKFFRKGSSDKSCQTHKIFNKKYDVKKIGVVEVYDLLIHARNFSGCKLLKLKFVKNAQKIQ